MDVGIGLPNAVAGTTGKQLVEFARQAEKHGFSSLGTIDRTVYDTTTRSLRWRPQPR